MRPRDLFLGRDFAIETSWPPSVVAAELRKRIERPRLLPQGDLPFVGRSHGDVQFRFAPRGASRNACLPRIDVDVEPSHRGGARLRVRMRPQFAVLGFAIVCAMFPVLALVSAGPSGLVVAVFPSLAFALYALQFTVEAREAERALRGIFAVAPALPPPIESGVPYR